MAQRRCSTIGISYLGQSPPIKEQTISFTIPNTNEYISWKSEYGEDIKRANFTPLALHISNGVPYIISEPALCLSYNKWGRPNPPYVIFKFHSKVWQRISLEELPIELNSINLVVTTKSNEKTLLDESPINSVLMKELNRDLKQPELKSILRKPVYTGYCPVMIHNGKGRWKSDDSFKRQPDLDACLKKCERTGYDVKHCPCNQIFGEK
ncbi:hypothetical protein [Aeromonas veronii]|uniref:hypothetical protein n=1 Tax=Aeromonas veronii TaxID=654 RepID=UPI002443EE1D|nr:hypothetical protein [Aeromonas veronii]